MVSLSSYQPVLPVNAHCIKADSHFSNTYCLDLTVTCTDTIMHFVVQWDETCLLLTMYDTMRKRNIDH